jgi:hypothetical protein
VEQWNRNLSAAIANLEAGRNGLLIPDSAPRDDEDPLRDIYHRFPDLRPKSESDPLQDVYRQFPHLRPKKENDPLQDFYRQNPGTRPRTIRPGVGGESALLAKAAAIKADIERLYKNAYEQLQKRQAAEFFKLKLPDHAGFSLDPEYDCRGLAKWIETSQYKTDFRKYVADSAKTESKDILSAVLSQFLRSDEPGEQIAAAVTAEELVSSSDLSTIVQALKNDDARPFLLLTKRLRNGKDIGSALLGEFFFKHSRREFQFQAARYDGDLQGTEIGMVLFYTDLLAKLWQSIDYDSPKSAIPDFRTSPDGGISPVYLQQTLETPGTRIWFGKEDRGFQITGEPKEILFARRATRIFAASSDSLTKDKEVPPIQASEQTIG